LLSSYPGRLDRLGVHYARAGLGISLEANPDLLAQGGVKPLPATIQAESSEVVIDGLPRRPKSCGRSRQAQPLFST
jgi:hypothetical protein